MKSELGYVGRLRHVDYEFKVKVNDEVGDARKLMFKLNLEKRSRNVTKLSNASAKHETIIIFRISILRDFPACQTELFVHHLARENEQITKKKTT